MNWPLRLIYPTVHFSEQGPQYYCETNLNSSSLGYVLMCKQTKIWAFQPHDEMTFLTLQNLKDVVGFISALEVEDNDPNFHTRRALVDCSEDEEEQKPVRESRKKR